MRRWIPEPKDLPPIYRQPLASVLITSHNDERFVTRAVERALRQTYRHVEVTVADDPSQLNRGMAATTNAAYRASKGSIICLLDADDMFLPDKIERVVDQVTDKPNAGFLLYALTVVDVDERWVQRIPLATRLERGWLAERAIRRAGRVRDMPTSALCFRREAAELEMRFIEAQVQQVNLRIAERTGTADAIRLERNLKHALCGIIGALLDLVTRWLPGRPSTRRPPPRPVPGAT